MIRACTIRPRTLLLAAVPAALAAFGVAPTLPNAAVAQEAATPTAIGVIESAEGLAECGPSQIGGIPEGLTPAAAYQIVSEASTARYRVEEELASVGVNEAVGETTAIVGQILFGEDGRPLPCSRFDVDLRTLQSDEARRDNFLSENTLQTATYPLATFVLRGVDGLDGPLPEGEETTVRLIGDLTLRGVTRLVAWEATVVRDGETLTGSAATAFEMPEFGIEQPRVPVVVSVDETIRLEIDLTAQPVAE